MDQTLTIEHEPATDADRTAARRPRRTAKATTLALVALIAFLGIGVAQADAAIALVGFKANGVNIRSGPSTGYAVKGLGYPGQLFCIDRVVSGQNVGGNTNWVQGRNKTTGVAGYVHASYVYGTWIAGKYYYSDPKFC